MLAGVRGIVEPKTFYAASGAVSVGSSIDTVPSGIKLLVEFRWISGQNEHSSQASQAAGQNFVHLIGQLVLVGLSGQVVVDLD